MGAPTDYAFIAPVAHCEDAALRLKEHAERLISEDMFEKRSERWPEDTPDTKEAYYIRDVFDSEIV